MLKKILLIGAVVLSVSGCHEPCEAPLNHTHYWQCKKIKDELDQKYQMHGSYNMKTRRINSATRAGLLREYYQYDCGNQL